MREVVLKPGWLLRDVRAASARLEGRPSVPTITAVKALEFYADPPKNDPDVHIPDFYDELQFGEKAREALGLYNRIEPTARGDVCAELMRRWYERNRESWWDRVRPGGDRRGGHADNFAMSMLGEASRIGNLTDDELLREF